MTGIMTKCLNCNAKVYIQNDSDGQECTCGTCVMRDGEIIKLPEDNKYDRHIHFFISYLEFKNVYDAYLEAFYSSETNEREKHISIPEFLLDVTPMDYLNTSFVFGLTKQGDKFWGSYSNEWMAVLMMVG